ncbi:hypothetical protein KXW57_008458 [Aspergillus fumigatus]|nr:hypothetical protein KXW57_008458 [Aspergillus fumigatus]KAH3286776.1 hypothetical protein KXV19_003509 [Aspergillus fumigatus]
MEEKASNTDSTAPAHPNSRLPQQSISSAPVLAQGPKTECTEKGTATEGSLTDPACQADDDSEIVKWDGENDPELPLNWPASKKWRSVVMVSALTFVTPFASSMFAPAINQVMVEMGTSNRDIGSFGVSIYLLGYAFGPLVLAPCSELYGRLIVYHISAALFILCNVACALSISMPMLIIVRFLTGLVGAAPLTIGPGTVADCFRQEQRGRAMAIWTMPVLLGPCLGPAIGAYVSRSLGWRWNFWLLIIVSGAVSLFCLVFQRETHAPTLLKRKAARLRKSTGNPNIRHDDRTTISRSQLITTSIVRPVKMLFLSPVVFGLSLLTAVAYGTLYLFFTTVTDVFASRYGIITNVGLIYLGCGCGQFAGLFILGLVSDAIVRRAARGGEMKPEYRLPPTILGGSMIPIGLLIYGWTAEYRVFWFVPVLGTFLIGFGMITVFTPVGTYLVDAFPMYAASATAANTVFRSVGGAFLPLAGPRMYSSLGQGWGNTLLAGISLLMMGMIFMSLNVGGLDEVTRFLTSCSHRVLSGDILCSEERCLSILVVQDMDNERIYQRTTAKPVALMAASVCNVPIKETGRLAEEVFLAKYSLFHYGIAGGGQGKPDNRFITGKRVLARIACGVANQREALVSHEASAAAQFLSRDSLAILLCCAMMNGLQTLPQWRDTFGQPTGALLGFMNAVYPVAKVIGLFPATWIGDRYGRKKVLYTGFALLPIGAAVQAAAQNTPMFIVAGFLIGFATSFLSQPSPILVTELAYPTHRATATALYNTCFYLGAVLAAWSTFGTFRLQSTWSWRIPSLLQQAIPAFQTAFVFWVPKSPRWLMANKKEEESRRILTKYHAGGDENSPLVEFELNEIAQALELEKASEHAPSYFELWNGCSVLSYYLALVLNTIGITAPAHQTLINGMLQIFNWIVAVCGGALLVDRVGRRSLFLVGTSGMLLSYIAWTVLNSEFAKTHDQRLGSAVLAFIFIYYFFYDISWTPLPVAYTAEIFPYTLRGRGMTINFVGTYFGLISGQFLDPIAMKDLSWRYYIVFCAILFVMVLAIYLWVPETKGRTLEEIAEVFDGPRSHLTAGAVDENSAKGSGKAEFPSACSQPDTANLGPGDPSPRETFRPQGAESVLRWQILASSLPPARCLFAQPVAEADQPYSLPDMSYSQLSRLESKYIEVLHTKNPILDLTELHRMVLHIAENGPDWSTQTCLVALVCAIAVLSEPYPGTVMRSGAQSTPSLHKDDESGADDKLSLQFWNIALKRLGYAMRENSVEAVQSLVLAGIWYMHRMEPLEAWKHFNLAGAAWNTLRLTRFPLWDLKHNRDSTSNELTILQALYFTIWKSECKLRLELPVPGPSLTNTTDFPLAFPQPPRLGSEPSTPDASESERSWYYYLTEIAARHLLNRLVQMNSECADTLTERQVSLLIGHAEILQAQIFDWYTSLPSMFHFTIPDGYDADFQSDPMIFVLQHRYFTLRELVARPFVRLVVDGLLDGMDPLLRARARSFASESIQFCMLKLSQTVAYRHQGNWYMLRSITTASLILASVHLAQCRLREREAAGATPTSESLMPPEAWISRVKDAVELAQPFFDEPSGGASNMKQIILAALEAAQQRSAWCGWRNYGKE